MKRVQRDAMRRRLMWVRAFFHEPIEQQLLQSGAGVWRDAHARMQDDQRKRDKMG